MKNLSLLSLSSLILMAATANLTSAKEGAFQKMHPRRAEVNQRELRQQRRIKKGVANGSITPDEAKKLEAEQSAIKTEERTDVVANHGRLTKKEKHKLNQELNQSNKDIKQAVTNDDKTAPAPVGQ